MNRQTVNYGERDLVGDLMQGRTQGGATGVLPQRLHDSPQCQERPFWVLKIVENLWVVGAQPRTRPGSSQRSPDPYNWWGG